jgi:hypothetical protein
MGDPKLVKVYYVCGVSQDGNGNPVVTDLAKFFRHEHAQQHLLEKFGDPGRPFPQRQLPYRDVGVVIREEREEEQHPAHRGDPKQGLKPAWG